MAMPVNRTRVLLLGGTSDASEIAERLASDARFDPTLSLAGRTEHPKPAPIPVRVGGFGGIDGLVQYLRDDAIDVVVDATHPFAAQMSTHAVAACKRAHTPLIALERPPWSPVSGDHWQHAGSVSEAIAALPRTPTVVFSGLGRLSLAEIEAAPHHHYVIRVIDPIRRTLALPNVTIVTGRGPFTATGDLALFREHRIAVVLAKNAGGGAAYAKIAAARELGLDVVMIARPAIAARPVVPSVEAALALLAHHAPSTDRGV